MTDNGWDVSDFLSRYTSKSSQYSSPIKNDLFNGSLGSDKSPQLERFQSSHDVFCTEENMEDRLKFLNQRHQSKFHKDFNENFDVTRLINCTYELLRRQHHQVKFKDDLEARQSRSDNDNEYLIQNQVRLKQDLENLKREAALLLCREKDQIEKCRVLQQEIKREREEKRKMKADVDHLKKQFYHETKRTEKEITRLKEKVHQVLNDKSFERKIGIDVINSLQRADGKRSTWKTAGKSRQDDEMYKMVISNYEDKEKGLLSENLSMREVLTELQNMLLSVDNSIDVSNEDEIIKQYQMPFHLVKVDVETKLKSLVTSLKERLDAKPFLKSESTPNNTQEDSFAFKQQQQQQQNEDLITKMEHFKSIIDGQEKIIQSMKDGYSIEAFEDILKTFGSEEDSEKSIGKRIKLLKDQEKNFNDERKHFTEYVLKMSKEKEEFEKERVEFYMHCLSTPVLNKDKKKYTEHHRGDVGKFQMVTPTFSPAPATSKPKTPSTAELYKFMSMGYDSGIARNTERTSSFDGSFVQYDVIDSSPSSKKLQVHADNVRKAVEEHHNKSIEEEKLKNLEHYGLS